MKLVVALFALVALASAKTLFSDDMSDVSRWVQSTWKPEEERGALVVTAGKHGDGEQKGLQTSEDARFYTYSTKIAEPFALDGQKVVFQFTVKHEQSLQCGGAYLKFHPSGVDQEKYHGGADEDAYNIMFGPDWCGTGHKRIHAIFAHGGKNHLLNPLTARAASDSLTHRYALEVEGRKVKIILDDEVVQEADLAEPTDYDILPAKEIADPAVSKPDDWVDEAEIPDPDDHKPEGYDDIPATIADPDATKPDDWDDELDGEWEAPQIPNPEYKGPWVQKKIPNPDYLGPWVHPKIANPEYVVPDDLGHYKDFGVVGIEIWQVQAGTVFDNLLITDSREEADAAWAALGDFLAAEKKSFEAEQAERAAAEAAAAEAAEAEAGDDDDDDDAAADADDDEHDEL